MVETQYSHPKLGFGFDIPPGWALEPAYSTNPLYPLLLSMRAGPARVVVAVRGAPNTHPAERSAAMKHELAARNIEAQPIADALHFPGTGNVAAVEFLFDGTRQRWISLVTNGVEFSFTHTEAYSTVEHGLQRLAATFRMPPANQARQLLSAHAQNAYAARPEDLEGMSHYQRVAARFNVPAAERRKRGS